MREVTIGELLKVSDSHIIVEIKVLARVQSCVSERLELQDGLLAELLGDAIRDIRGVLASVTNLEGVGRLHLNAVDRIIDAVTFRAIALTLTFLELHPFDVDKRNFIAILEVQLLIAENLNKAFFLTGD